MTPPRPRLVFGAADPARYRLPSREALARGGPLLALCHPPEAMPHRADYLAATEARGVPCHRCIANEAPAGAPARCGFLSRRTVGGTRPDGVPLPSPADPDGFGL